MSNVFLTKNLECFVNYIKCTKRGTAQMPLRIRKAVRSKDEDVAQRIPYFVVQRIAVLFPRDITISELAKTLKDLAIAIEQLNSSTTVGEKVY